MKYVNVGALDRDARRIPTKAALKRAVNNDDIAFDQTAFPHDDGLPGLIEPADVYRAIEQTGNEIVLSVVGPDPYNRRMWYASVTIGRDGKLKVK